MEAYLSLISPADNRHIVGTHFVRQAIFTDKGVGIPLSRQVFDHGLYQFGLRAMESKGAVFMLFTADIG